MMHFKPFKMATYSQLWPTDSAIHMHSSNPEPFSWQELQTLTHIDLNQIISQTPFGYESTQGNWALREQLTAHHYPSIELKNLALTAGAQEGIFIVINSLLSAGDEVITFTPCFEPLVSVAQATGAKVNTIELNQEDNWSIPWDVFDTAINAQTKLVIINFPHNPTGSSINRVELERLIAGCEKHGIWLFSDEVFRGLEHDDQPPLPTAVEQYEKGISMGVMSKSMALPGIRLGWLAAQDLELVHRWLEIKSHLSICQSSLDTSLTTALLPYTGKILQRNIDIIAENKLILEQTLSDHPEFKVNLPKGSATAFVELINQPAETFCLKLLNEKLLFVMPNPAFMTDISGFRMTLGKRQAEQHYQNIFNLTV